jgi:hypothetical protein
MEIESAACVVVGCPFSDLLVLFQKPNNIIAIWCVGYSDLQSGVMCVMQSFFEKSDYCGRALWVLLSSNSPLLFLFLR